MAEEDFKPREERQATRDVPKNRCNYNFSPSVFRKSPKNRSKAGEWVHVRGHAKMLWNYQN